MNKDWTIISSAFNYQKLWESLNLSYEDAQVWVGSFNKWKAEDCVLIVSWIGFGFSVNDANIWSEKFGKKGYLKAAYFRGKNFLSKDISEENKKEFISEYKKWLEKPKSYSEYLNLIYPYKLRRISRGLIILDKGEFINSELTIEGNEWQELREIKISHKFEKLNIQNCLNLTRILLQECGIKGVLEIFRELKRLNYLDIGKNKFAGSIEVFAGLDDLKILDLHDNSEIIGDLELLKNLTKISNLDVRGTAIFNQNTKSLSDSLLLLYLDAKLFSEMKNYVFYDQNDNSYCIYQDWKKEGSELYESSIIDIDH